MAGGAATVLACSSTTNAEKIKPFWKVRRLWLQKTSRLRKRQNSFLTQLNVKSKAQFTLCRRNLKTELSIWKGIKCFPSTQVRRRNLKTQNSPVILDLCLRKTGSRKSRDYGEAMHACFLIIPFSKCFPFHMNQNPAFSNSSGLKRVFEKLRFHGGLVWMVGLTVEMELRIQITPACMDGT